MTDIKCPICKERISGRSQDELTEMLSVHLADTHRISRISGGGGTMSSQSGTGSYSSGMAGRESGMSGLEVPAWSARDPSMLTPEESRQRDEITRLNPSQMGTEYRTERRMETWSGMEPTGETPESSRTIQESTQWKYPRMETEEERAAGTWRSESRSRESERSYYQERPREERGYGGATSLSGVRHGGGTLHRMMNRGEMTMAMDCPLCGNPVYGSDDDDLSDELRFHFKDFHQIRRR